MSTSDQPEPDVVATHAPVRHVVVGARGGQGASTVAAALAALSSRSQPTALLAHDPAAVCDIVGAHYDPVEGALELAPRLTLAAGAEVEAGVTVVDAGPLHLLDVLPQRRRMPAVDEWRWLVLRGPSYLGLRTAAAHAWKPHGVIVLREPGRLINARDVSQVLDRPVVVELRHEVRIARAVDAGTLLASVGRGHTLGPLGVLLAPAERLSLGAVDPTRPGVSTGEDLSERLDRLERGPGPGAVVPEIDL